MDKKTDIFYLENICRETVLALQHILISIQTNRTDYLVDQHINFRRISNTMEIKILEFTAKYSPKK